MEWNLSGRKLQLCAMSIIHVEVCWVTESLNNAYALNFVKLFFLFLGMQLWFGSCRTCSYGPVKQGNNLQLISLSKLSVQLYCMGCGLFYCTALLAQSNFFCNLKVTAHILTVTTYISF